MNTDSTFFEALIASLNQQRSTLPNSGQKPLCDVILRCGGIATQAHSSVLVALSTFFARILTNRKSTTQVYFHIFFTEIHSIMYVNTYSCKYIGCLNFFYHNFVVFYLPILGFNTNFVISSCHHRRCQNFPWR